jgi:hypothetical protein
MTNEQSPEARDALETLGKCWDQWTEIVRLFSRRRAARYLVDVASYRALYRDLLAACRSLAANSAEDRDRAYYAGLAAMVESWVSPASLERADRMILDELLRRCVMARGVLSGRPRGPAWNWKAGPVPMAWVPAIAALLLGVFAADMKREAARVTAWFDSLGRIATGTSTTERLGALAVAVIIPAIFAVHRMRSF